MFSQQIFIQGLGMGASLIMPIGAQNAHVIRTSVRGRHVILTVAACILIDISLIALGMSGFGALVEASPRLLAVWRYGGAIFLLWYGLRCLLSCWRGDTNPLVSAHTPSNDLSKALATVVAMSLLNPHVYLDTVVLLGAVGTSLAIGNRTAFAAGAMTASLLWFSILGLVASRYASVLARPAVWRAVEAFTGTTMLIMAAMVASE